MCLVNETGNCPFGYVCDLHHPSDAYFCCQREMVTTPKALTAPLQPSGNQIVSRSLQSSGKRLPCTVDDRASFM